MGAPKGDARDSGIVVNNGVEVGWWGRVATVLGRRMASKKPTVAIIQSNFMAQDPNPEQEQEPGTGTAVETAPPELARPPMYQVVLLNDDYTPMDFVVSVLQLFFSMNREKATQVMLHVHTRGKGVCGIFTREVAETKVTQVNEFSRKHQHPLMCTLERISDG